ncbi:MAG TPA: hypothetical protein VK914_01555 [bacterium]|nr:hypothetical protein [bacterium]
MNQGHEKIIDYGGDPNQLIHTAARVIGKPNGWIYKIFVEVYKGKQKGKTWKRIASALKTNAKVVAEHGIKLKKAGIVLQKKIESESAYFKEDVYAVQRDKILSVVNKKQSIKKFPTASYPNVSHIGKTVTIKFPLNIIRVKEVTIDDIDSFKLVKSIKKFPTKAVPMPERQFKNGIRRILKEKFMFFDWGGEKNDLATSRLILNGKRIRVAFGFKGPGQRGELTPRKMGKNGDQIQRLFSSVADVFILQYWDKVGDSVHEQMKTFAQISSVKEYQLIRYCVIDGTDSARLIAAYTKTFNAAKKD